MKNDPVIRAIINSREYQSKLDTMGERAVRAARSASPDDTGKLDRSLDHEITPDGELVIYSTVGYAANVDRGDAGRPGRPLLSGAAMDALRREAR